VSGNVIPHAARPGHDPDEAVPCLRTRAVQVKPLRTLSPAP